MSEKSAYFDYVCILAGAFALMCLGLGYGWSVFRGPFHELYPQWTEKDLSFVFSLSMIFFGAGSFICGILLRFFRLGKVLFLGTLVFFLGFAGVSYLPIENGEKSFFELCFFYGICSGSGIGICYNALNSSISRFFPEKKGFISGIMMAAYGSGALILGTVASKLIQTEKIGLLNCFRILALVIFLILLICTFVYTYKDTQCEIQKKTEESHLSGFTPCQVLQLKSFWILQIRNVLSYAACLMIIEQSGNLSATFGMAAASGLVLSVANGLFRIPAGIFSDRFGNVQTLRLGNLLLISASGLLLILNVMPSRILFFACILLFGMSYGTTPPVSVSINEEFFGAKYRTVNYAFFSFTLAPASILGPTVLGILRDCLGESIQVTAVIVSLYALAAFVLSCLLKKPNQSLWITETCKNLENTA